MKLNFWSEERNRNGLTSNVRPNTKKRRLHSPIILERYTHTGISFFFYSTTGTHTYAHVYSNIWTFVLDVFIIACITKYSKLHFFFGSENR